MRLRSMLRSVLFPITMLVMTALACPVLQGCATGPPGKEASALLTDLQDLAGAIKKGAEAAQAKAEADAKAYTAAGQFAQADRATAAAQKAHARAVAAGLVQSVAGDPAAVLAQMTALIKDPELAALAEWAVLRIQRYVAAKAAEDQLQSLIAPVPTG